MPGPPPKLSDSDWWTGMNFQHYLYHLNHCLGDEAVMPEDLTNGYPTLFQVMAWCHQAASHYLSQCWPDLCHYMVWLGQNGSMLYHSIKFHNPISQRKNTYSYSGFIGKDISADIWVTFK